MPLPSSSPNSSSSNPSEWLVPIGDHQKKNHSQGQLSLFCFPPAGAGATFYRPWLDLLPHEIDLWAIRLPGRENRLRQPLITRWDALLEPLVDAIQPHCQHPFAFFGHSFGALLGFETACQLRDRVHVTPQVLVVSGREAPHIPITNRDYRRTDTELIAELRSDGGTPEAILQNSEFMELVLPIYRADLQLNQDYCYPSQEPLSCPIVAFGGQADRMLSQQALPQWEKHTQQQFQFQLFPGSHMYLTQPQKRESMMRSLLEFIQHYG